MAFYRIKDAAEKIGVLPHVLRFWESQFPLLRPSKTSRGQRLYSDDDVEKFLRVKHLLYVEGYSIAGAKKVLRAGKNSARSDAEQAREDALEREFLKSAIEELQSLREFVKEF